MWRSERFWDKTKNSSSGEDWSVFASGAGVSHRTLRHCHKNRGWQPHWGPNRWPHFSRVPLSSSWEEGDLVCRSVCTAPHQHPPELFRRSRWSCGMNSEWRHPRHEFLEFPGRCILASSCQRNSRKWSDRPNSESVPEYGVFSLSQSLGRLSWYSLLFPFIVLYLNNALFLVYCQVKCPGRDSKSTISVQVVASLFPFSHNPDQSGFESLPWVQGFLLRIKNPTYENIIATLIILHNI